MARTQWPMPTEALPPLNRRYEVPMARREEHVEARARAMLSLIDISMLQKRHTQLPELSSEIATLIKRVPEKAFWWGDHGAGRPDKRRRKFVRTGAVKMAQIIHQEGLGSGIEVAREGSVNSQMPAMSILNPSYSTKKALQTRRINQLPPFVPLEQNRFGETGFDTANQVTSAYSQEGFGSNRSVKLEEESETGTPMSTVDAYTNSINSITATSSQLRNFSVEIQSLRQDIQRLNKAAKDASEDAQRSQAIITDLNKIVIRCTEAQERTERRALDIEVELFLLKMKVPEDDADATKRQRARIEKTLNNHDTIGFAADDDS